MNSTYELVCVCETKPDTSSVITLPSDSSVIIRSCSLVATSDDPYYKILVPEGSTLIFDDANIVLHTREIFVEIGGSIEIGGVDCRVWSDIEIYFHGSRNDSRLYVCWVYMVFCVGNARIRGCTCTHTHAFVCVVCHVLPKTPIVLNMMITVFRQREW